MNYQVSQEYELKVLHLPAAVVLLRDDERCEVGVNEACDDAEHVDERLPHFVLQALVVDHQRVEGEVGAALALVLLFIRAVFPIRAHEIFEDFSIPLDLGDAFFQFVVVINLRYQSVGLVFLGHVALLVVAGYFLLNLLHELRFLYF